MADKSIPQKLLNTLFEYRNGVLYWKINKPYSKYKAGDKAGRTVRNGYIQVCIDGNRLLAQQIIFKMFNGYIPNIIDHINGNVADNRVENLRSVTQSQNCYNSKISTRNKSGVKNVCWVKASNKWHVQVSLNKKQQSFGFFESLELADLVATEARNKYHGEYVNHGVLND